MSYSLNSNCQACTKREHCTDRHVIEGAICGIHYMPFGIGHLGAGSIDINCSNFEQSDSENQKQG